ncbi:MAG: LamG domain-containing protein [Spirochaetes bacterium]|nr:LamG domain-containing protein [Spirochaetota bacterium]
MIVPRRRAAACPYSAFRLPRLRMAQAGFLAVLCLIPGLLSAQASNYLMAWYRLDERSGSTAVDAVSLATATVTTGIAPARGLCRNALQFPGTNGSLSVNCGNAARFDVSPPFTLELWMKGDSNVLGPYAGVLGKYSGTASGFDLMVQSNTGNPRFSARGSSGIDTGAVASARLLDRQWHHLVVLCSNNAVLFYVDGAFNSRTSGSWNPAFNTASFSLGMRSGVANYNGLVDEVRLYTNYGLTAAEILDRASWRPPAPTLSWTPRVSATNAPLDLVLSLETEPGYSAFDQAFWQLGGGPYIALPPSGTTNLTLDVGTWSLGGYGVADAGTAFATTNSNVSSVFTLTPLGTHALTVRTVDSNGQAWAGARIMGPSMSSSPSAGVRTNDVSGESRWSGLVTGTVVAFTNFLPRQWGGAPVVARVTLAPGLTRFDWVIDNPQAPPVSAGPKGKTVFFSPLAPSLHLESPIALSESKRVVVEATPLRGGRRVRLFDGVLSPAQSAVDIPAAQLRDAFEPGVWVLEYKYPQAQRDDRNTEVARTMLFFGR